MLRSIGFSDKNESAGISKSEFRNHKFFAIFGKYFRIPFSLQIKNKNVWRIRIYNHNLFNHLFNTFLPSSVDLNPNCDNTRDFHPSLRGNVNLEVTFKKATEKTVTVLMYTASLGGISVGKDFDVQMLSSDY